MKTFLNQIDSSNFTENDKMILDYFIQHKNHQTMTEKYISNYNVYYKDDPIKAPEGVCYCVVEK